MNSMTCPGAAALRKDPAVRAVLRGARRAEQRRVRARRERQLALNMEILDSFASETFVKGDYATGKMVPL